MSCSITDPDKLSCPLCGAVSPRLFHVDAKREYLRCEVCKLVFVPTQYHLSAEAAKAEYDLHQNSPDDQGYRKFLSRLVKPLSERLCSGACGVDFGCGPGPTLSVMLEEAGFEVINYDPVYFPDNSALTLKYDFVTCTEVVEHFARPRTDFPCLFRMLMYDGILGIMTKLVKDQASFKSWHYIHDPTHISFYSKKTFIWLANRYKCGIKFIGDDVILMQK